MPSGIYKRTKEHKKKISDSMVGRKCSKEHIRNMSRGLSGREFSDKHKRNLSKALKGRKLSDEWKMRIGEAHKGSKNFWYGKKLSEEHRKKLREFNTGKKRSKKTRRKMSLSRLEYIKNNPNTPTQNPIGRKPRKPRKPKIKKARKKRIRFRHEYPEGTTGLEKKRFRTKRYKARKKKATGSHTFGEWELLKKQYGYMCPACGVAEPEIKLTQDHIIPLSKGGSDYIENIQPLCASCNTRKYTNTIKYSNTLRGGGKKVT